MNRQLGININQLAKGYANGTICPRQVIESALNDLTRLNKLNAFITVTDSLALQQATEASKRYSKGNPRSLLEGVPIGIKDNFCTQGIRTTCASNMLKDFIAPYNATVTERLLAAGAVLIGKTNMDEFAMGSGTVDSIYGPTKNVWSADVNAENFRIAGGSSGGSATAVAAGICFAAIGSDTGGSTRNPASYCGIVGLKPTYGLVSRHGLIPLVNSMDVPGIFARNVKDCATVLNAIAGPCSFDSTNIKKPHLPIDLTPPEELNLSHIRVGIPLEYHPPELSAEVLHTWNAVADLLEDGGAVVQQMSLPHTADSIIVYAILNKCEVASNMARYDGVEYGLRAKEDRSTEQLYAQTREDGFNSVVKGRILAGNYFLLRQNYDKYFMKALRVRRLIANDFIKAFEKYDVLLTPTTLTTAPLYKQFVANSNPEQCAMQDFCTQSANMAGIPAISIPVRLSQEGLPISLQLMSRSLSEQSLLTLAQWIEAKVDFNSLEHRLQQASQ